MLEIAYFVGLGFGPKTASKSHAETRRRGEKEEKKRKEKRDNRN
jgi:hypothetical protein